MMKNYDFTLIVLGEVDFEQVVDALYEAGCDDATMSYSGGIIFLHFVRESTDFEIAVLSAIADIETAVPKLKVKGLEPSDLVTLDDIACRLGYSEEYTSKLLTGRIDSINNPPLPYANVDDGTTIWSFKDVINWLYASQAIQDSELIDRVVKTFEIEYFLKMRDAEVLRAIDRLGKKLKDVLEWD